MRLAIRAAVVPVLFAVLVSSDASPLGAQASPAAAPAASPAPDPERLALTRELFDLMRLPAVTLQGLEMGLASQKATAPGVPEAFWTEFSARARRDVPKFVESVAPIYASRFTADELRQFAAFYRTPAGRHLAEEGAAINVELMRAGQRWGIELASDVMKELAAKGVLAP